MTASQRRDQHLVINSERAICWATIGSSNEPGTQATSSWELVSEDIHAVALQAVETAAQQLGGDQIIETGHDDADAQPKLRQRNVLRTWPLGSVPTESQPSWHPCGCG